MTTNSKPRSVAQIISAIKKAQITFDNYLQRKSGQWSRLQKSKLIDSILRGYPIPPVYAVSPSANETSIIDGCQRLTSIYEFLDGSFKLSKELKPMDISKSIEAIGGKMYDELSDELKDIIRNTDITIVTLTNYTDDELVDVFDRLNGGTPLSSAQKSKVYMNFKFATDVSRVAELPIFSDIFTETQTKRDTNQEVVVQSFMLLLSPKYPFNGFGKASVRKFLIEYTPNYNKHDSSLLADIIDSLGDVFPADKKTIKKTMLPPIIKAIQPIYGDKSKMEAFKAKLEAFLIDPMSDSEYSKYALVHTSNKENVEGRVAFFEKMAGV